MPIFHNIKNWVRPDLVTCKRKKTVQIIFNQLNICVEVWDYKPVDERMLLSLFDQTLAIESNPGMSQKQSKVTNQQLLI
jgi:calcineurin-like phosphoesterase family protein